MKEINMTINFEGKVAIVTGAGNGLGRSHALELARRGAKVVVNDLGGARDGSGASSEASQEVVGLIEAMGGEAISHGANVANFDEVQDMVTHSIFYTAITRAKNNLEIYWSPETAKKVYENIKTNLNKADVGIFKNKFNL